MKSEMAARRSRSPVNGSQLFASGVSRPATVSGTASGGSGRSVSRFSIRRTERPPSSAAAATRSIPKPRMGSIRFARRIILATLRGYVAAVKVGIVVPYSWSFWGGVLEHADHQARALRALGVDARLILGHDPPGRLTKLLHPKEGRHTPPPDYAIPVGRSVIVPANASLPNIVLSPNALVRMKRIFERERFDVVHVHEPLAPILSVFALLIAECPTVATSHAAGGRLSWYPLGKAMWGVAAERIDRRIAVSE